MSLKSKIQALITAANAKTGEADATLTDAVQTLVDGYGQGDAPVINPLSVTANGTYTAPSGVDGYSPVTVNVPQGITPTGNINITDTNVTDVTNYATAQVVDADLVAENIKKDVNILGVVGTFEGGGSSSPYPMTLLHDLTITEDVHSITVNWDNAWFDYDILLVEFDVTLSGATYIDFNVNGVSTSGNSYTAKNASQRFRQVCPNLDGRTFNSYSTDGGGVSFFSPYWSSAAKSNISKDTLVSLDWVCDTASVNFVSGTVKVFGGKMV